MISFSKIIEKSSHAQLVKYATQGAIAVATVLFIAKTIVWLNTGSQTVRISLLDSAFDICVSCTNYLIILLVPYKTNNKFFCYHRIAALATFTQGILMLATVVYSLLTSLSFDTPGTSLSSLLILFISLILSSFLVNFQHRVYGLTNSIIVQADMMHYQTDLFMNGASIICLFCSWVFEITWIDPVLALIIGLYLLKIIAFLITRSLKVLIYHRPTDVSGDEPGKIFSCGHNH